MKIGFSAFLSTMSLPLMGLACLVIVITVFAATKKKSFMFLIAFFALWLSFASISALKTIQTYFTLDRISADEIKSISIDGDKFLDESLKIVWVTALRESEWFTAAHYKKTDLYEGEIEFIDGTNFTFAVEKNELGIAIEFWEKTKVFGIEGSSHRITLLLDKPGKLFEHGS